MLFLKAGYKVGTGQKGCDIFLCTGALHYVPYSFSLFSNTFCFSWILEFSECIMFLNCTSAIKKYYARVL